MADLFESGAEVAFIFKPDRALAVGAPSQNFGLQVFCKSHALADSHLPSWMDQRLPCFVICGDWTNKEYLNLSAQMLMALGICLTDRKRCNPCSMAEQPRGEDPGVVQH